MTQPLHESPSETEDNTVVLARRPLRPDSQPSSLSRFEDVVRDLSPGIFENHTQRRILNFEQIPSQWLRSVKSYFWILINEETAKPILDAPSTPRRLALASIAHMISPMRWIIHWFDAHGYDTLQAASPKTLDRLLADSAESGLSLHRRRQIIRGNATRVGAPPRRTPTITNARSGTVAGRPTQRSTLPSLQNHR